MWLRRGVRSDAQLSCTDTRLQKCSQSGKNGSKHPMLSISMAYNVISCQKKSKETLKKSKSLILLCKFAKKMDHPIAIFMGMNRKINTSSHFGSLFSNEVSTLPAILLRNLEIGDIVCPK